ncbi:peptidoglycan-associated lipoprotein Pal [Desulfohalobium retbaense]|uniref:Peptidoglycan-associated lipoprotein n=1 Tax=Desulfohalobium retbaense (strain ATCC 49708 / DSM 5692 / JCM 16813 / HR100) TaxID=485915 RepID=C8X371_DESRD|nr:peptidoglycan-associated lipoprotein Pal [Desulfohalobium retbaense]ACV68868.1 peptidoglycan-associated lipoprotein [Desulfohalobium retbaense DSM 5692]
MDKRMMWGVLVFTVALLLSAGCAKKQLDTQAGEMGGTETTMQDSQDMGPDGTGQDGMDMETSVSEEPKDVDEWEAKESSGAAEEEKALSNLREEIYFDFDSFELKPDARDVLQDKAALLDDNPGYKMIIEGHCDERGTQEYNLALGERRARAAYEFLILLGIDANRLQIVSYGEERPAVEGSNEAAWAKNRRCEFKIYE